MTNIIRPVDLGEPDPLRSMFLYWYYKDKMDGHAVMHPVSFCRMTLLLCREMQVRYGDEKYDGELATAVQEVERWASEENRRQHESIATFRRQLKHPPERT